MNSSAPGSTLTYVDTKKDLEERTRPLNFRLIIRLMRFMKPHAAKRNCLILIVLLRSAQLPFLALTAAWILSGPITKAAKDTVDSGVLQLSPIWFGVAVFAALAVFTQLTMHFRQRLALELGEAVVRDLRRDLFTHLQKMTMGFYDRTMVGRIISRMTGDIESVRSGIQDMLFVSMVNAGQLVISAMLMIWTDLKLCGLLLLLTPVIWGISRFFGTGLSKAHRATRESFSRVTANLAESVNGIRVTQGFVRQKRNADLFGDLVSDHSNYQLAVARLAGIFTPLLETTNQIFLALLLIVGGYLAFLGQIETDSIFRFIFLSASFFLGVQTLTGEYLVALEVMAGAERIFGLLDTEPEWRDSPNALELPPIEGLVEFRTVTFGYDPNRPVLHGISFTALPGQTLALVGHTGSGKSSIINLIAKFYQPDSGELLIDGMDIRKIRSDSLHHQMGIVLQQNFLFSGTVMDNIRFGWPDAPDEQVVEAARNLDCLDFIEALPNGFDTEVGERGINLSLGQRQLVCFTRAMLANPHIMILDEATSSVDTMTEARIQRALNLLLTGRTSFVVAHRLSTIRHADLVLVIDHGHIVERGTHNELLATGGIYANLYRQFIQSNEG